MQNGCSWMESWSILPQKLPLVVPYGIRTYQPCSFIYMHWCWYSCPVDACFDVCRCMCCVPEWVGQVVMPTFATCLLPLHLHLCLSESGWKGCGFGFGGQAKIPCRHVMPRLVLKGNIHWKMHLLCLFSAWQMKVNLIPLVSIGCTAMSHIAQRMLVYR